MNWFKVKTILITLFLFINIFLLINIMFSVKKATLISTETINNTVEVLEKNNIQINSNIIPTRMSNLPILEMENYIYKTPDFIKNILGVKSLDQVEKKKEGGYSHYLLNNKKLSVRGCEFTYNDSLPSMNISNLNKNTAEDLAKKKLEELQINPKNLIIKQTEQLKDGSFLVSFNQKFSDKEIHGCYINVNISSIGLKYIQGYWLIPKKFTARYPMRDITSVLIDFIKEEKRPKEDTTIIKDISYIYFVDTQRYDIKTISVVPVWQITTADDNEYYYEAINIIE